MEARKILVVLAGILIATLGCGKVEGKDSGIDVSGSWYGGWDAAGYGGDFTFTLEQDGEDVSGTAIVGSSDCTTGGEVEATLDEDFLDGSIFSTADFDFEATVEEDHMEGTFTISGGGDLCDGLGGTFDADR